MIDQDTEIIFNKKVASDTFLMGLRSAEIVEKASPGQFVMIRVRSGIDPLLRRPFSICGTQRSDLFFILYRVVGRGTAILSKTTEGKRLPVLGPLGRGFELPGNGHKSLLVAGGIGVAPLIFLAQASKPDDVTFLTGYRSASEMVPIEDFGLNGMDISVSTDDGTEGHKGPVTELLEPYLVESGKDAPRVFACGPTPMLKRVAALTLDRGISCQVSFETTMACGLGACQGCAVEASPGEKKVYYHVCQDGPVFDVKTLDWSTL